MTDTAYATKIMAWGFVLGAVLGAQDTQAGYRSLYNDTDLQQAEALYADNVNATFYDDLVGRLPPTYRTELRAAVIDLSDVDPDHFPLIAASNPSSARVQIPIRTVKFLDDLSTALAWLQVKGCNPDWLYNYVAMLIAKPPPPSGYPDPREAFSLPADPWSNESVYIVSGNMLKSGLFFIMAHELGHIYFSHLPYGAISSQEALRQEFQADQFALDAMRNIGVPPLGTVIWFTVASLLEEKTLYTHPLSGNRIVAIAEALEKDPWSFVAAEVGPSSHVETVLALAHQMRTRAAVVDDDEMRRFLLARAVGTDWTDLAFACDQ